MSGTKTGRRGAVPVRAVRGAANGPANGPAKGSAKGSAKGASGAPSPRIDFALRGEHIALDALLKATGLAGSGGAAKPMIAAGEVRVDGEVELRRGCKLRAGQVVELAGTTIVIAAADGSAG